MTYKKALDYHRNPSPGKLEVMPSKPLKGALDLSLAYSPGVAVPCLAIAKNRDNIYEYTIKGNLVGVITNGSAVLGLGDIGAEAAKPVMEGKAILMKQLAGLDAFDLEIEEKAPDRLVEIIKALAPTFGAINLEDIKAPTCFAVEKALQSALRIPVIHDDQHSTAIVVCAALKNALLLVEKDLANLRVVVHGAGAGAIASASLLHLMGVPKKHIMMFDSRGLICKERPNLSVYKASFATEKPSCSLKEALVGADFFLGLSVGNVLKPEYLLGMSQNPIVFALANPEPEIGYSLAKATRKDIIMATGRSDFPNQVNNVLAFPSILRGLLDVRSITFNDEVKLAAIAAIASIVHQGGSYGHYYPPFSADYLIPEALDPRLLLSVAPAVARAAMKSEIAQKPIQNWKAYKKGLEQRTTFGSRSNRG